MTSLTSLLGNLLLINKLILCIFEYRVERHPGKKKKKFFETFAIALKLVERVFWDDFIDETGFKIL